MSVEPKTGDKPKVGKTVDVWSPAYNAAWERFDYERTFETFPIMEEPACSLTELEEPASSLTKLVCWAIEGITSSSSVDLASPGRHYVVFRCIDSFGRPWATKNEAELTPQEFAILGLLLSRETQIPWDGAIFSRSAWRWASCSSPGRP